MNRPAVESKPARLTACYLETEIQLTGCARRSVHIPLQKLISATCADRMLGGDLHVARVSWEALCATLKLNCNFDEARHVLQHFANEMRDEARDCLDVYLPRSGR